jgi:hypothetical protein
MKLYLLHNITDKQLMDRCGEFVTMETGVERFYDLLTSI